MALPFAIMTGVGDAGSLATGITGGIMAYNRAKRLKTPQEREAERLAGLTSQYNEMLMNPNDPRFKEMVESESQGIRGGFLQNLRDAIEANRRQAIMGRQQIFDPERRDENIFSQVDKSGRTAQLQARSNVIDRINQAIKNLQAQQSTYTNLAQLERDRRGQKTQAILGGLGAINKSFQNMGNMGNFMGGGQ